MGSLSDAMEIAVLDHVLKNGAYSQPTNIYLALVTTTVVDSDTGASIAEPGSNYARVIHNTWDDPLGGRASENTNAITFVEASGSWGTIVGWAIVESASGAGLIVAHGDFAVSSVINSGDTAFIADGDIDVSVVTDAFSDYLADVLLQHILKGSPFSQPSNIYVAAVITDVVLDSDTGTSITEPSGGAYARELNNDWDAAAGGASENTNAITFITASGAAWGTVIDFALVDALTVGNVLIYGNMDANAAVDDGDTLEFVAGGLDITLD